MGLKLRYAVTTARLPKTGILLLFSMADLGQRTGFFLNYGVSRLNTNHRQRAFLPQKRNSTGLENGESRKKETNVSQLYQDHL